MILDGFWGYDCVRAAGACFLFSIVILSNIFNERNGFGVACIMLRVRELPKARQGTINPGQADYPHDSTTPIPTRSHHCVTMLH